MTGSVVYSRWTLRDPSFVMERRSRYIGEVVDGKRCVQPLNVAGISFVVGRRSRVSGEGGSGEGVWSGGTLPGEPADDGKRV